MKVLIALLLGSGLVFANAQTSDLTSEITQVEESVEISENQAVEGSNEVLEYNYSNESFGISSTLRILNESQVELLQKDLKNGTTINKKGNYLRTNNYIFAELNENKIHIISLNENEQTMEVQSIVDYKLEDIVDGEYKHYQYTNSIKKIEVELLNGTFALEKITYNEGDVIQTFGLYKTNEQKIYLQKSSTLLSIYSLDESNNIVSCDEEFKSLDEIFPKPNEDVETPSIEESVEPSETPSTSEEVSEEISGSVENSEEIAPSETPNEELTDVQKLYEFITNELTRLGLNGIVTLLTTIAGIIVMFFKLRKETRSAVDTLKGTNDSTTKQNQTIDTLVNQLEAQNKQHSEEIETLKATYEEQLKAKDKEIEEIKTIANNMKKLNNIPQAISLLTSSLPEMTKSGVAKQVADTLGLNDDNVKDIDKKKDI